MSLLLLMLLSFTATALAAEPRSNNYQFGETFVGGGGLIQENSAHFRAGEAIGDTAIGDSNSSTYSLKSGFYTTPDPSLAFSINNSNANFGILSTAVAATATASFDVTNYTSYGYVVQVLGQPPNNGGHVLPGLSSPTPSQVGVEQFGLNVVANTSPISFGANPVNTTNGLGVAATGYNSPNNYKYVQGETIASAPKSSGLTTYTISYIINVRSTTDGGVYSGSETLICTGTY